MVEDKKKVLVLGGHGRYGKKISQTLADIKGVHCVAVGRHPPSRSKWDNRITHIALNVEDSGSVRSALADSFIVINASGVPAESSVSIAMLCLEAGVHYIDLSDSRHLLQEIVRLNRRAINANVCFVAGAASVPAISSLLVDTVITDFDRVSEIQVFKSPGNNNIGGAGTLVTELEQAGRSVRLKESGRWREVPGWSRPLMVHFPKPVGLRRLYLCDAPDLDIFPQRYGASTVTYRTGYELNILNFGISFLAWLKKRKRLRDPARLAPGLLWVGRWFRRFGSDRDAVGIHIKGQRDGVETQHAVYMIGKDGSGLAIATSPVIALTRHWIEQGPDEPGAFGAQDVLRLQDIKDVLKDQDVVLVRQ